MSFYDDFADIFEECVDVFDERAVKIKFVRHSDRVMNSITRELDTGTTSDVEINAFTIPFDKNQIDGTAIREGDVRVITDANEAPLQGDDVVIDGDDYSIVKVGTFNPGGVVLGYDLQVRR